MALFHGVQVGEVPTAIIPPVNTTAGLPVVFGTAPVHLTEDPMKYVNKPVICYSWDEAVKALGYSDDWDNYTLCEAMYSEFKLYAVAPIIFVNVLDPTKHKKSETKKTAPLIEGKVELSEAVLLNTLKVRSTEAAQPAKEGIDYTAAWDDDGRLIIAVVPGGPLASGESIVLDYDAVDPTAVDADDIIGGASAKGESKGLELIDKIYTQFSLVPGIIAAPGWSEDPAVASVMKAKALNIDGLFRCIVLTDVDTAEVKAYSDVNEWKNKNNYTGTNQVVCWPCVRNGKKVFHLSTHLMGVIGVTDAANGDIPYRSPSNISIQATGICLKDGSEISLSLTQADLLNTQGVVTGLNFNGGWKSWGNCTGAYPSKTDVKDSFICVRRMFDWQYQTFILTYWQILDAPLTPRLIRTVVDSETIRLNGLVSRGYLLGSSVKFLESENPRTDLLRGIFRIHSCITPPVPAQKIEDILEYDVNNFQKLFA